jgi:RNA polymerase sigma-70 factor (ECF subfamily)
VAATRPTGYEASERELVIRATIGDIAAFDQLVRIYRNAVTLVARNVTGSREMAEDMAQESFLLAFKALPQLGDPSKFPSWLMAIVRNRSRRAISQANARRCLDLSAVDNLILAHAPNLALAKEAAYDFEEHLEGLAPEYREVLALYYGEDWPIAKIASYLALQESTVKWRLHHGRKLLRQKHGVRDGENNERKRKELVAQKTSANA